MQQSPCIICLSTDMKACQPISVFALVVMQMSASGRHSAAIYRIAPEWQSCWAAQCVHVTCSVNRPTFCQYSSSGGGGGGGCCALLLWPNVTPGFCLICGCDARGVMCSMSSPSQISNGSMTSGTSSAGDHLGVLGGAAAPFPCIIGPACRLFGTVLSDLKSTCNERLVQAICFYRLADTGDDMQLPRVLAGCGS